MSSLQFEPVHEHFGARVSGVDLSSPIAEAVIETIREAIDTYSFLCFPGQSMTDDNLLSFACDT